MYTRSILLSTLLLFLFTAQTNAQEKSAWGNNILSFTPLQISASGPNDNPGPGFGLAYERNLGSKDILAFYLPVSMSFNSGNNSYSYGTGGKRDYSYFFMPGLKFYPTGSKRKVAYGVGPSLAVVTGSRNEYIYIYSPTPPYNSTSYWKTHSRLSIGTMIFNSLNINPSPHLFLNLEIGLGVGYVDMTDGNDSGNTPFLFQSGFKVGYRF